MSRLHMAYEKFADQPITAIKSAVYEALSSYVGPSDLQALKDVVLEYQNELLIDGPVDFRKRDHWLRIYAYLCYRLTGQGLSYGLTRLEACIYRDLVGGGRLMVKGKPGSFYWGIRQDDICHVVTPAALWGARVDLIEQLAA